MKEFLRILDLYEKIDKEKLKAALATVICVEGSSYRRPGARMLITSDGKWEGAISGGCLEGDVLRKARRVMEADKPDVITYNTTDDSSDVFGIRLGCNGIIKIFIQPLDFSDPENPVLLLKNLTDISEPAVLVTIFDANNSALFHNGQHLLYNPDAEYSMPAQMLQNCKAALHSGKSCVVACLVDGLRIEAFFEVIQPQMQLLVFGAGYDVYPLVQLAKTLGWRVILSDECLVHLLSKQRGCADTFICGNSEQILKDFRATKHTAVVLISHNYNSDVSMLKNLIQKDIPYIGILGPKARFRKMLDDMAQGGSLLLPSDMDRIFAPIGLDIGAETPEEIALSVIGEIKSVFSGRSGQSLRNRQGPIHEREKQPLFI